MSPHHKQHKTCSPKMLKFATFLMGICLSGYIIGPPLYWHLSETMVTVEHLSCPPCHCDCDDRPLVSFSQGLNFSSFTGCMKRNPNMTEEMEKSFTALLSEELEIKEAEARDNQQRADMALLEAKKMASQYQKEADKCNSGMETCEEAREKAEDALRAQQELTVMWEMRARQKGWRENVMSSNDEANNAVI